MINQKLVDHLINGSTLLTPTRRLASRLLQEINSQFAKHQNVWATPKIYALGDWFKALWNQFEIEGETNYQYLNSMQSLLRWEEIIQSSEKGKILFQPHVSAKTALSAWKICHQWVALNLLDEKIDNIEVQTFQEWAKAYQSWLLENQFIDEAQLPNEILHQLQNRKSKNYLFSCEQQKIVLFGFEEFSPFYSHFFETLAKIDWEICYCDPEPIKAVRLYQKSFTTEEQEWKAAARWAQEKLLEHKKNIAIVTPHLTSQRNQIEEVFNDCLTPLHICQPEAQINDFFNISTAIPLIQYPIIQSALDFLKLGLSHFSLKEYIDILISPFSKGAIEENILRASYGFWLKTQNMTVEMNAESLRKQVAKTPPIWLAILSPLLSFVKNLPEYQSFVDWAKSIDKFLTFLGWPGDRALNSVEHQAMKRWEDLLNEMQGCDNVLPPVTFSKMLSILQKLTANVPFQAENKGAPIQILGILEAAGQHFDHLWVMGLHSQGWPPVAMPNPFLPLEYQRLHHMPHASPERELQYAKKVTARLEASAKEIIFSYALQQNERILEQSELIRHISFDENQNIYSAAKGVNRAEEFFTSDIVLENKTDLNAPAITIDEDIRFSSNTLTLQAACPFKAFAQIRLKAKEPFYEEVWLNAQQQGTLIHRILDEFWKGVPNQAVLLGMTQDSIETKLSALIEHHLKKIIKKEAPLPYIQVEKQRLNRLLKTYLSLEKSRAPFEIVALESQKSLNLSGMHFTLRLDRIDKNPHGDFYIIDYKTGKFSLSGLWGARLSMPQLPLYYLSANNLNPKAVFVAKIQTQGCEFEGISEMHFDIPGVKILSEIKEDTPAHWEDLKAYWTTHLNTLAIDFQAGNAQVAPLEKSLCTFCHLKAFCRIGELA